MAIRLRENETVIRQGRIHWSSYSLAYLMGLVAVTLCVATRFPLTDWREEDRQALMLSAAFFLVIFVISFTYQWLQNKLRSYIITNQRVFLEEGILARIKTDLPLNKINDISLHQSLIQRILGSGNVVIYTGNDSPAVIRSIDQPEDFKDALSKALSRP